MSEYKAVVLKETPLPFERPLVDTPERAAGFFANEIEGSVRFTPGVENFVVILLNTRRRVDGFQVMSTGTLDTILVHPREVFRVAIVCGAAAIVLLHNHPSGDPTPSEADVKVTRDMIRAGQLLRIEVLDHVIIGQPSCERAKAWTSLRELGYFYS